MEDQMKTGNEFNSERLLLFLTLWKKPLAVVAFIAAIASIIFSSPYFIPPKYRSMVIMYPASTSSISKVLLSENNGPKQDILEFGEEQQAEQMLQILNSNGIRDRIILKYDLQHHYKIKDNSRYKLTELYKEYEANITFRRTENMAIKITVLDTDPQIAADIANDIAALFDSTKAQMQRERAVKAFRIVESEYEKLKQEIQIMEDSLTALRALGVFDYESQSEMINQQLAKEIANNNRAGIKALEEKLDILALYGGPYVSLRNQLEHEKKQLSLIKSKYEEAKVDAEQVLPQKFVVNTAYKAEKKSYPIRWLIVLVSIVGTLFTAVLIIVILEQIPGLQLKKKTST